MNGLNMSPKLGSFQNQYTSFILSDLSDMPVFFIQCVLILSKNFLYNIYEFGVHKFHFTF